MPRTPTAAEIRTTSGPAGSVMDDVRPSVPRGTPGADHAREMLESLSRLDRIGLERLVTAGQLAGMFAHELSNILTPLLSYAQLAMMHPDDEALRTKALGKAVDGAERAAFLADALLGKRGGPDQRDRDVESAVDPMLAIAPRAVVLDAVRKALATAFRAPGAAMDRARLGVHIEAEADLAVAAHPIALEQVLLNLINNARLAQRSQHGGGAIRVAAHEAECSTGNTRTVEIRIQDDGPGIPEHVRARLFQPFVTSRPEQGGLGLGLAVCRQLIEQAGGSITLAPTQPGCGAEFVITLPAAARQPAANAESPARRLTA